MSIFSSIINSIINKNLSEEEFNSFHNELNIIYKRVDNIENCLFSLRHSKNKSPELALLFDYLKKLDTLIGMINVYITNCKRYSYLSYKEKKHFVDNINYSHKKLQIFYNKFFVKILKNLNINPNEDYYFTYYDNNISYCDYLPLKEISSIAKISFIINK